MIVKAKVNINYNGEEYEIGEEFEYDNVKYPRKDLEDIFEIIDDSDVDSDVEENEKVELPDYDKTTADKIKAELDKLGIEYDEKADKKALYILLKEALKEDI